MQLLYHEYIQMQQISESQLIRNILAKFQQDEAELTRFLLNKIQNFQEDSFLHLKLLNIVLSNKNATARQRRDVAAIARAVADSNVFSTLQIAIDCETNQMSEFTGAFTMQTTRLIWLICAENPHFVDNINGSSPTIIERLFKLFSKEESTPTDSDPLQCIVNFFHAVSMKESAIRAEKLRGPFQSFLVNILSKNRFCEFTQHKKYQLFIGALFKFQSNVPIVANYIYHSMMTALKDVNEEYKELAEDFKGYNVSRGSGEEMTGLSDRVGFADKKLASIMKLYQRSKSNVFYRFDAFSFTALLKILIKIAIMRPVALVGLPSENRILCNIIGDLMQSISNYHKEITRRKLVQPKVEVPLTEIMQQEISFLPDRMEELQPHEHNQEQEDRNLYSQAQLARFEHESTRFTQIREVTCKFSDTFYKIIKSTIDTLVTAFKTQKEEEVEVTQARKFNQVLIEILTVRLERILSLIMKLFGQDELKKGSYYKNILAQLYDLLPYYFELSLQSQMKCLKTELPLMKDVTAESEISLTRYLFERLEEESVKNCIHTKLGENINCHFTIYEAITKFGYHLSTCQEFLQHSAEVFIHKFIGYFQECYLKEMMESDELSLREIQCLRIGLKFIVELFPVPIGHDNRSDMDNKHKIYWYCRIAEKSQKNTIFQLLANVLNLVSKHNPESTTDLIDTLDNRQEVVKTIFTKLILQRIRTFVTSFTAANLSQISIALPTSSLHEATVAIKRQFTQDYVCFAKCVVRLITDVARSGYEVIHKEDVVAILMTNIFAYNIDFGGEVIEEIRREENELKWQLKIKMDQLSSSLLEWIFSNLTSYINKLPMIIKKVLHFNKMEVAIQNRELEMNQEQNLFIRQFFVRISHTLNQSHYKFTNRNLNLGIAIAKKQRRMVQIEQELNLSGEISKLANICTIVSQFLSLLSHQTLALMRQFLISDNYVTSIIDFATYFLSEFSAELYFKDQANALIRNTLWLVSNYLIYKDHRQEQLRQKRQFERKEKRKRAKKQRIKAQKIKKLAERLQEGNGREMQQLHQENQREEVKWGQLKQSKNNKRRRRRGKKNKKRLHPEGSPAEAQEQDFTLRKSRSKPNLMQGVDKLEKYQSKQLLRAQPTSRQKKEKNRKKKKEKSHLQNKVQIYLKQILIIANKGKSPLLSNLTLQYYLKFISQNLRVNILTIPLHKDFELNICDILDELLRVRVTDAKIPAYHLILCKLGIQMLDENHLRVDYQMGIKRYLFQNIDNDIQLCEFVKFSKQNFQEMPNTSHLVQIIGHQKQGEETKTIRLPFIEENYEKLMAEGKGKKYRIVPKEGVQLHILNTRTDTQLKRKPSNTMEDQKKEDKNSKSIKVTDYVPEGEINSFVKALIHQTLKIVVDELDRSYCEQEKEITYYKPQTVVQPFNIKVIIHTLQLLIRESPSLSAFIAKYKCKRPLLSLLKTEGALRNRQKVVDTVMGLLGFKNNENDLNNIPEIGFLSVILKLLSPMVTNSISGLLFQLCLDSTPLVQLTELPRRQKQQKKSAYAPFGSVIRLKVIEQMGCIVFQNPQTLESVFRKLCIANLVTVLMNLREMAKLFIEYKFVERLLEEYQILKTALSNQMDNLVIPSVYCTKILIPFFLQPIGLLQQINIWLHHNKKLNKIQQKVRISEALNVDSINAQIIPQDAFKRLKFKVTWPYNKKDENHVCNENQNAPFFVENLSDSEQEPQEDDSDTSNSEDFSEMSSSSAFSNRYAELEEELNGEQEQDSYVSLEEAPQRLLNEEWDYDQSLSDDEPSQEEHINGIEIDYPQQDIILESGGASQIYDRDQDEEDVQEGQSDLQGSAQEEGASNDSAQLQNDFDDDLNSLDSSRQNNNDMLSFNHIHKNSPPDDQDLFENICNIINFEKINVVRKISKVEIEQVLCLRFFLQLSGFHKRMMQNLQEPRIASQHQIKEERYAEDHMSLLDVFSRDQHLKHCEWIEWNQIYRYDHFLKEAPLTDSKLKGIFSDEYEGGLLRREFMGEYKRRNAVIIDNRNLMQILPRLNITDIREGVIEEGEEESGRYEVRPHDGLEVDEESHSPINLEDDQENQDDASEERHQRNRMQNEEEEDLQQIHQILRSSNLNMSADQFFRLDPEIQEDIIQNYMLGQLTPRVNNNEQVAQRNGWDQESRVRIDWEQTPPRRNSNDGTPYNSPIRQLEVPNQLQSRSPVYSDNAREQAIAIEVQPIQGQPLNQARLVVQPPEDIEPQQANGNDQEAANEQGQPVHETYRKMSMQHSKKISKDLQQAINKDGKNNSKFTEVTFPELDAILEMLYVLNENEHRTFPYNTIETFCMNTENTKKIVSSLVTLLHLYPSRCQSQRHPILNIEINSQLQNKEQRKTYEQEYPIVALKILHMIDHLTKTYSIAMSFFTVNDRVTPSLEKWLLVEQRQKSSFQMLIWLLRERVVAQSSQLLQFLVSVLSNLTVHHFYKSINKIVERQEESDTQELVVVDKQSVELLGNLLQSNFIKENLHVVSKIIMRLSIQEQNLNNFIIYLEHLMRTLVEEGLQDILRWTQEVVQEGEKEEEQSGGKIVNLMYIFYEMVKAFETFPTTSQKHETVLQSFRRIVEYPKLEELCQTAVHHLLTSTQTAVQKKMGSMLDCFFILYEVALITSHKKVKESNDEHKFIAELGEINLKNELKRGNSGGLQSGQEILLGGFSLSKLWRENITNPNFKVYINNNIKSKLTLINREHTTTRGSIFEVPIIRVAASTPHMLSFQNKRSIFKAELKRMRGKAKHDVIHLCLSRDDVFEQSYEEIIRCKPQELKGKLKIEFKDEQGEDAGGLTREWFQLLSRKMFDPNYALFRCGSAGNTHHPSSMSYVNHDHLNYFKFIGRIAGKALYDGFLLDAYFTPAFYKHILNLPITYLDMEEEDYEYFKSLKWIMENSPIEDYLELNFTYECDNFGEIQTKQLVAGGSNMLVTEQNKLDYVQLVAYARMATNIKPQLQSFLQGLHDLIPHGLIKIFNEKELEIMISGRPTIDIEDLKANTELVNYVKNDQIILWLFEVLESFDMELRTAFIQFVTGSSRVPVEGFKDLRGMNGVQKFNIHREFQEERLPRAHTCFNQLDLPNYRTKEILIDKLMLAITEGKEGFGMI